MKYNYALDLDKILEQHLETRSLKSIIDLVAQMSWCYMDTKNQEHNPENSKTLSRKLEYVHSPNEKETAAIEKLRK